MHFDISNTGLTLKMFEMIVGIWRKIMSLQTFHMSSNPFIKEILDWKDLLVRLKSKPLLEYS